jgi:NAD(P)-dependent dehydrogenase (short-subunit alcohol dehydrogenase family)
MKLAGDVALITGGARGLGYATAENIAHLGGAVCIFDRDADRAREAAEQLKADYDARVVVAGGDVTSRADIEAALELAERELGPVDMLVNAAGIVTMTPFAEVSEEEWDRVLEVDLTGIFLMCQIVGAGMAERGRGRIINIASLADKRGGGFLGTSAYATAKAAVMGFSKALARELAPTGVTVNSVAPGAMDTEMTKVLNEKPELLAKVVAVIPLGRRGVPREVADPITFLCTADAAYITGETVAVDGGVLME